MQTFHFLSRPTYKYHIVWPMNLFPAKFPPLPYTTTLNYTEALKILGTHSPTLKSGKIKWK